MSTVIHTVIHVEGMMCGHRGRVEKACQAVPGVQEAVADLRPSRSPSPATQIPPPCGRPLWTPDTKWWSDPMTEFYLPPMAGGIHCMQWTPRASPGPWCSLVHGIAGVWPENSFARFLNRQGFLVVGEDHMGHGGSPGPWRSPRLLPWRVERRRGRHICAPSKDPPGMSPTSLCDPGPLHGFFPDPDPAVPSSGQRHPGCRHLRHRLAAGCRPENRAGYVPPRLSKSMARPRSMSLCGT